MEFDDKRDQFNEPERKSGGKKWIFGGCGCLFLILLVCGGSGLWGYWTFVKPAADFIVDNMSLAQSSEVVQEKLGSPVENGASQQDRKLTVSVPVSGPKGSGTLIFSGTIQDDFTWKRDEIYLEFEGERTDLDPESELDITIEGL